ncbi:hypothetical protein ACROYT_G005347 [Oculina patagonica]
MKYLQSRNPFDPQDASSYSIDTGVIADESVNVDRAVDVGQKIVDGMIGHGVLDHVLKKKEQVPNKSQLADAMWNQVPDVLSLPEDLCYLLDGGALLHRIPWPRGETYDTICSRYLTYVINKYRSGTVVFDGYESGPSTKDRTHNVLIVQTTIATAERRNTALVGDDTDLLVLLCSRAVNTKYDIYFRPETKSNSQRKPRCWNIEKVRNALGEHQCENLLFAHAILGCDTTSRVFGIGKSMSLKKIESSAFFRKQAEVFKDPQATRDAVIAAGEIALVCLYNDKPGEKLDVLRLQHFQPAPLVYNLARYLQRHLPPLIRACVYIIKCSSGIVSKSAKRTGDGRWSRGAWFLFRRTCRQLQRTC